MMRPKAISPAQCRAGRAMLRWTQKMLAQRAGVARTVIVDFESNGRILHLRTRRDITAALETGGIQFAVDASSEQLIHVTNPTDEPTALARLVSVMAGD